MVTFVTTDWDWNPDHRHEAESLARQSVRVGRTGERIAEAAAAADRPRLVQDAHVVLYCLALMSQTYKRQAASWFPVDGFPPVYVPNPEQWEEFSQAEGNVESKRFFDWTQNKIKEMLS
jgi:hypothetical protein